ncbi:MAG: hypothetical protein II909_01775 [Kiritimatiellae bacterium]|nr:hypothetical protein [Kiritimatiellia bacterium]
MIFAILFAAVLYSSGEVTISGDRQIDPARDVFIVVTPKGIELRDKFRGFRIAEDYEDETSTRWRLVPEPWAKAYKIAPFAYGGEVHGPVYFEDPTPREPVAGGMTARADRVWPPLTFKLVAAVLGVILLAAAICALVVFALRLLARRVREHFMSPIERARVELDRLVKSNLPAKGRFKDFYVELTMVVRRYIQRKYSIKAPNLTTEEFLALKSTVGNMEMGDLLKEFLESADMVKFAGVAATLEMSETATRNAREYLEGDNAKESK